MIKKLSKFLLFLLLSPCLLNAQTEDFAVTYNDFSGGFNDWTPSANLSRNQSPNTQNLIIDESIGKISKRKGYANCGNIPSGNKPVAIFNFTANIGDERLIITDSENFYETTNCTDFVTIVTGLTVGTMPDCEMVYSEIWCVNGSDAPWRWDGTTRVVMDGSGDLANIPNGSFIEFERGRVWIARTGSSRSSLFFSGLTNIDGDIIVPSSSTAWIAANEIFVAKDDGDVLQGLVGYLGTVFPFKKRSIYKLTGTDEISFGIERVLSDFGTNSDRSIVEIDGLLHILGIDALYQFDGANAVKLLDTRSPLFRSIQQPETSNDGQTWTTQNQWNAGTFTNTSSTQIVGSVYLSTDSAFVDDFSDGDFTNKPTWTVVSDNWSVSAGNVLHLVGAGGAISVPSTEANGIFYFTLKSIPTPAGVLTTGYSFIADTSENNCDDCSVGKNHYMVTQSVFGIGIFKKCVDGVKTTLCNFTPSVSDDNVYIVEKRGSDFNLILNGAEVCNFSDGSITSSNIGFVCGSGIDTQSLDVFDDLEVSTFPLSGTWESEIVDAGSSITAWGLFKAKFLSNNSTLDFEKKLAVIEADLSSAVYETILSGQSISTAAFQFAQFRASFSRTDDGSSFSPELQDIVISWQGGGNVGLFPWATSWKGRYWLTFSSGSDLNKGVILVKSREPSKSFMPYFGISANAFTNISDTLYSVSGSTDDILILDVGFRDNTNAIDAFWETTDDTMGLVFNFKYLHTMLIDYQKTGLGNFQVGYSTNSGNTFIDGTIFQTGSGRALGRVDTGSGPNTQYRFRLRNNAIDEQMEVHSITAIGVIEPSFIP